MAYLVLALGAPLSVGGALSIFHGAGIVEVERGWTGVIAGATSLTGGIVTIALGLILKTLLDLRRGGMALQHDRTLEPIAAASPPAASIAANPHEPDLEGGLLAAFLAPEPAIVAGAVRTPLDLAAQNLRVASGDAAAPEASPAAMPVEEAFVPDAASEAVTVASPARSRFRISFKTPSDTAEPPSPPIDDHPQAPAMDDWLDRAFSSLDNEPPAAVQPPPDPAPARHPPVRPEPPMAEPARSASLEHQSATHDVAEVEGPDREPPISHPRDLDEPAPPAAEPPQSAVIGRYEADGTSYVMFADGSIEAQSEAGVYRFSSMSELKAFIEGTG